MTEIKAEMAASVLKIEVAPDASVTAGDEIAILESMKMEIPITSPVTGTVTIVHAAEGAVVDPGDVLLEINPS